MTRALFPSCFLSFRQRPKKRGWKGQYIITLLPRRNFRSFFLLLLSRAVFLFFSRGSAVAQCGTLLLSPVFFGKTARQEEEEKVPFPMQRTLGEHIRFIMPFAFGTGHESVTFDRTRYWGYLLQNSQNHILHKFALIFLGEPVAQVLQE